MGITLVKCSSNKPTQPVKGPGSTGKNEPIIPIVVKRNPTMSKKISIVNNLVKDKKMFCFVASYFMV